MGQATFRVQSRLDFQVAAAQIGTQPLVDRGLFAATALYFDPTKRSRDDCCTRKDFGMVRD
jgi:hypothetical protein